MRQTKIAGVGLEDFINCKRVVEGESTEVEEMFCLAVGFAAWMQKQSFWREVT